MAVQKLQKSSHHRCVPPCLLLIHKSCRDGATPAAATGDSSCGGGVGLPDIEAALLAGLGERKRAKTLKKVCCFCNSCCKQLGSSVCEALVAIHSSAWCRPSMYTLLHLPPSTLTHPWLLCVPYLVRLLLAAPQEPEADAAAAGGQHRRQQFSSRRCQ